MSKNIWLISDTHFGHANILNFTDSTTGRKVRPEFETVQDMDEYMIEKWNSVVKPQDKVYHLGDVYFNHKREVIASILGRLNGHKRLILGNHDNAKDQSLQRYFEKVDVWRKFSEFGLLLTHVPVHQSVLQEGRFLGAHTLNVHGHIHQNPSPDGPYQCVCVEQINYTPVNIEDVRIR